VYALFTVVIFSLSSYSALHMCRSVEDADVPVTHKDPIHAIAYNKNFKQLITCSEGSVRVLQFQILNKDNIKNYRAL